MLHIRQIRFISLSSANCRCSTTTCQDSLSESSHVRQNHSTWCFGLLTAIYFDVLSQYGILRGSTPQCQQVLLYFPAARCYRFVEGKNTDNLQKKEKGKRICKCAEGIGAKMCPGLTARGQYHSPVPHRSAAGGTGDSSVGTLHFRGTLPLPTEAQAGHRGTGDVIYMEPCVALGCELGHISGTATTRPMGHGSSQGCPCPHLAPSCAGHHNGHC